jgi:hypothetical protein
MPPATKKLFSIVVLATIGVLTNAFESELWDDTDLMVQEDCQSPLPTSYINPKDLPDNFSWGDIDGRSYLTHSLNQHIPQCKSAEALGGETILLFLELHIFTSLPRCLHKK